MAFPIYRNPSIFFVVPNIRSNIDGMKVQTIITDCNFVVSFDV